MSSDMKQQCCDYPFIIQTAEYWVCNNCGCVHDILLESPQLTYQNREHSEALRFGFMGSRTTFIPSDIYGITESNQNRDHNHFGLLRQYNNCTIGKESSYYIANFHLNRILATCNYNIPLVVKQDIIRMIHMIIRSNQACGRKLLGLVIVACDICFRYYHIPIILEEILDHFPIKFHLFRYYDIFMDILQKFGWRIIPYNIIACIRYYGKQLGYIDQVILLAQKYAKLFMKSNFLLGKKPTGIVAGSLYLAGVTCKQIISQRRIQAFIGVNEVTIRNRTAQIKQLLERKQQKKSELISYISERPSISIPMQK